MYQFVFGIYDFFIRKTVFYWVCHNNDYTSIGYKHGNIMSNIINCLVHD